MLIEKKQYERTLRKSVQLSNERHNSRMKLKKERILARNRRAASKIKKESEFISNLLNKSNELAKSDTSSPIRSPKELLDHINTKPNKTSPIIKSNEMECNMQKELYKIERKKLKKLIKMEKLMLQKVRNRQSSKDLTLAKLKMILGGNSSHYARYMRSNRGNFIKMSITNDNINPGIFDPIPPLNNK